MTSASKFPEGDRKDQGSFQRSEGDGHCVGQLSVTITVSLALSIGRSTPWPVGPLLWACGDAVAPGGAPLLGSWPGSKRGE